MRRWSHGSLVDVWVPERGPLALGIMVRSGIASDGADGPRVEAAWAAMRAENPRLYDAPMMALEALEIPGSGDAARIVLRVDSYKRFVVQDAPSPIGTDVTLASVTGRLVLREERSAGGALGIVMGKRQAATRVYPGLWEHAPSGGLDPARFGVHEADAVFDQLRVEAGEELGVEPGTLAGLRVIALVRDRVARSLDIVVGGELSISKRGFDAALARRTWELSEVRVVGPGALRDWMDREPGSFNPQTLALERALDARGSTLPPGSPPD